MRLKKGEDGMNALTGRRWIPTMPLCCVILLATACTDLTAVREWSKTSLEAARYNELITTYADTPRRLKRYDTAEFWDSQIAVREKQAEALKGILSVVSDYMAALSVLSADGTVDYTENVDTLTGSIGNLDAGISQETLGAVGSLVKDMLGAAAKTYQARQVAIFVGQANGPLQEILHGELREIVDEDFRGDLETERVSISGYYDDLLRRGSPSPAAKAAVEEWKELRLERNSERMKALDAYLVVLDKVAEGHQKLYDNRNELDGKTLIKELRRLVKDLRKQIRILAES